MTKHQQCAYNYIISSTSPRKKKKAALSAAFARPRVTCPTDSYPRPPHTHCTANRTTNGRAARARPTVEGSISFPHPLGLNAPHLFPRSGFPSRSGSRTHNSPPFLSPIALYSYIMTARSRTVESPAERTYATGLFSWAFGPNRTVTFVNGVASLCERLCV